MKRRDLSGKKFGRLTAVSHNAGPMWLCRCECGNEKLIHRGSLLSGRSKSCGCFNSEVVAKRNHVHGLAHTPTHACWNQMIQRCENPATDQWKNYGERGIKVCDRWHVFANFLSDMGIKPDGMTIDRIDNNGNYEPGNCQWKSVSEQSRNRRTNVRVTMQGETLILKDWAARLGINYKRVHSRIKSGWSAERALTTPIR